MDSQTLGVLVLLAVLILLVLAAFIIMLIETIKELFE